MFQRRISVLFVCVSLGCASSPGGGGGGGGVGQPAVAGCATFAQNICNKMFACQAPGGAVLLGTAAECTSRLKLGCDLTAALPDIASDRDQKLAACAATIGTMGCSELDAGGIDACTSIPGLRANGKVCRSGSQCQSTYCKMTGGECGTCAPTVAGGGDCDSDKACGGVMSCHLDGTCGPTKVADAGAVCDADKTVCPTGYGCVGGICKKAGGPGDACDPQFKSDDCNSGQLSVFCHDDSKTCAKINYVDPGASCAGSTDLCRNGYCAAGTCIGWVKDGEACDENAGKICKMPAECLNKICTLPSAGSCN